MTSTLAGSDASTTAPPGPAPEPGRTTIADGVVQKIAGLAAQEVPGVHRLGAGAARALGALRDRLPGSGGSTPSQGVSVDVGDGEVSVELDVVVEYGVAIPDLARDIRAAVVSGVERMTGMRVTAVDISVDDVHLPGDDGDDDAGVPVIDPTSTPTQNPA